MSTNHHVLHEWEAASGYRFWTGPFTSADESRADYAEQAARGHDLSDTDCTEDCPGCAEERASSEPRVVTLLRSHDGNMRRLYAGMDAPCFIHSFWRHEVSYQSQVVPGVSVTIDVLMPHYTDRWEA